MRLFCHCWCLTTHNFTHTCHLHVHTVQYNSDFTVSPARLWCYKAKTSVFVFCRRRSGRHSVTNALWQYITRSALQYNEAQMCPWLTIKCRINRLCVCFPPTPPSSPVQAGVMDHLAPWAMVAAGAFVIQTESNSRVLFLLRRQKHNLGKTERLRRGRPHILTATSRSRLSEGFIWLELFLRGLCASGNTWEMEPRYLLYWHFIYLFIFFGGRGRKKSWTWFAHRLDWMFVQQNWMLVQQKQRLVKWNEPENHITRATSFLGSLYISRKQ